ncbi:MAG: hypothetical protein GY841_05235 [FCB group bacterium]|nr:hypothetical protein [FCB group bacterium]
MDWLLGADIACRMISECEISPIDRRLNIEKAANCQHLSAFYTLTRFRTACAGMIVGQKYTG